MLRQWYRLLGAAEILGNPIALFDSLGGGVLEFFRAPAEGFLTDGLLGLGYGVKQGMQALVAGALGGAFEYVTRLTGQFVGILESITGVHVGGRSGDGLDGHAESVSLTQGMRNAFAGAVLKPYRGAKEQGALGFGKGVISGVAGVAATVLLFPLTVRRKQSRSSL